MDQIKITNLHKHYRLGKRDVHAVRGVDLSIATGHVLALVGPSGCGKTSILRMLAGIERPTGGRIEMASEAVFDHEHGIDIAPDRRNIGMVFQNYALWPHLSVFENVAYPFRRRGKTANLRQSVMQLLDSVGVAHLAERYPSELSGGQQQRIAFARALAAEPRVVLFDEPLSNLDFKLRERLKFDLKSLQRELRFTAVYVTHDRDEALTLADSLAVLSDGQVQQVGAPEDLYRSPSSEFVFNFLGDTGHFAGIVAQSDPDWTIVRTSGRSVRARTVQQLPAGAAVRVGFHTDGLDLVDATRQTGGSPNIMGCTVLASFFAGSRKHLSIRLETGDIARMSIPADQEIHGENAIALRPANCFAFPGVA